MWHQKRFGDLEQVFIVLSRMLQKRLAKMQHQPPLPLES